MMKHKINPQVDCVFKAILGSAHNKAPLIHFINSIIQPAEPIDHVEITNPYNEKEFASDKLTIVDIKAIDPSGCQYQIEIQITCQSYLPQRMLYSWCDIYRAQLQNGEPFTKLNPVISIWLLIDDLFDDST